MVKIIDVGQTMRAPGLYRVAKDYIIKEQSMRILTKGLVRMTSIELMSDFSLLLYSNMAL